MKNQSPVGANPRGRPERYGRAPSGPRAVPSVAGKRGDWSVSSSALSKVGGLSAVAGGCVLVASALLALFAVDYTVHSEAASTVPYAARTASLFLGGTLMLGGLVGIHARQAEATGVFGLVGFVAAFLGMALSVSVFWSEAFLAPILAQEAPAVLDAGLVLGERHIANVVSYALGSVGWLLFGLATLRAGVFPRPAAVLLVLGTLVSFAQVPASEAVIAVAVAWLGAALLRSLRSDPASVGDPPPKRARA